jgi:hypothetical protein
MLASLIKMSSASKPHLVETLLTVIIQGRFNNISALKLAVICLSKTQLKVCISFVNKMCVLLIYSPSPSLSIAICKISFSTHVSINFVPTTLPKYYSSEMLSLNSYTPCSIYIRRTHVKSHMLNLLFVLIAAHCRYQTSAYCPFYNFLKPNESYLSHPFSAVGRSYPIRLLKVRWRHFNL